MLLRKINIIFSSACISLSSIFAANVHAQQDISITKYLGNAINNEFYKSYPDSPIVVSIELKGKEIKIVDLGASLSPNVEVRIKAATRKFIESYSSSLLPTSFAIPLIMGKVRFAGSQALCKFDLRSLESVFAYASKNELELNQPIVLFWDVDAKPKQ